MAKRTEKSIKHEFDNVFFVEEISWGISGKFLNIDFKTRQPTEDGIIVKHKPMTIDIYQAKEFISKLLVYFQNFEKKYGVVEKPEFLKKFEKDIKKKHKAKSKEVSKYIG